MSAICMHVLAASARYTHIHYRMPEVSFRRKLMRGGRESSRSKHVLATPKYLTSEDTARGVSGSKEKNQCCLKPSSSIRVNVVE